MKVFTFSDEGLDAALLERGFPLAAGTITTVMFDPTKQAWRMEVVEEARVRVLWGPTPSGPWGEVEGVDGSR